MNIYDIAEHFANQTTRSIFLTGKAGTGKTTFLKRIKENSPKQLAIVAPTGVAAINAGGVTIHSFFQLPFTPFVPTAEGRRNLLSKLKMSGVKRKVLQELELLIIDEISMVRADIMDEIDVILRHFRFRYNEPFGGVQLICIGDLYQLSPVAIPEEWDVLSSYYPTPYFFDSQVITNHPLQYLEFDKVFRQSDATFIQVLNAVRDNRLTHKELTTLQKRVQPQFDLDKHKDHILLTTHNAKADRINDTQMARLKGKEHLFRAQIQGEFPAKSFPNHEELRLKVGAKVMFIANDTDFPRRYFNGKIGTISNITDKKEIYVHCDDQKEDILVKTETWENIKYTVDPKTKQIEEKHLGAYIQYPLRLAWAITIHKSQGLTFDKAAIDVESAFTSGQVYVALSRCRTLEGMVLLNELPIQALYVDPNVTQYSNQKPSADVLEDILTEAKSQYNTEILLSIFNFNFVSGLCSQAYNLISQELPLFGSNAMSDLKPIRESLQSLTIVGAKFSQQIIQLTQQKDHQMLKQRIASASDYFVKELDKNIDPLEDLRVHVDDKELAAEYALSIETLHDALVKKSYIISNIRKDYSSEHYFKLNNRFKIKPFKVKFAKDGKKTDDEKELSQKKEKKENTLEITLRLYNEGFSDEGIAEQRGLAVSTIEGHLAKLVAKGKIDIEDFASKDQIDAVAECFKEGIEISEVYERTGGCLSYSLLRLIRDKQSK